MGSEGRRKRPAGGARKPASRRSSDEDEEQDDAEEAEAPRPRKKVRSGTGKVSRTGTAGRARPTGKTRRSRDAEPADGPDGDADGDEDADEDEAPKARRSGARKAPSKGAPSKGAGRAARGSRGGGGAAAPAKEEGWGKTILWVVIAIVIGIGAAVSRRASDSADVQKEFQKLLREMPAYQADRAYVDSILPSVHEAAFSASYTAGGRRRAAKLDERKYLKVAFAQMRDRARQDGKEDLAGACQLVVSELGP
ncbi:MAG: hypothetical protein AB7N76_00915 [Planctomycetota bacterium]